MLVLLAAACLGAACRAQLQRPETVPARMIEPRLVEPAGVVADAPNATSVRLLETQGRAHIGRRVLHQQPDGEVTEDPVWLWTSTPDRYLDSALRLAIASNPDIRLVDVSSAPSLAVTLVAWQLEAGAEPAAGRGRRGPGDDAPIGRSIRRSSARRNRSRPTCPATWPRPPAACWGVSPPTASRA